MSCPCPRPLMTPNPRCAGNCVKCGKRIEGDWVVTTESMDTLHALLVEGRPIPDYETFRAHAAAREYAGRQKFGYQYLSRDNAADGLEEAADGANYAFFELHKMHRTEYDQDSAALLLDAAYHFAQAHHSLRQAISSREGTPTHRVDE